MHHVSATSRSMMEIQNANSGLPGTPSNVSVPPPLDGRQVSQRSDNKLSELERALSETHIVISHTEPSAQLSSPAHIVDALEGFFRRDQVTGFALTDKVHSLVKAVRASATFGLAVLTGKMTAETLARCSKSEIDQARVTWHNVPMSSVLGIASENGLDAQVGITFLSFAAKQHAPAFPLTRSPFRMVKTLKKLAPHHDLAVEIVKKWQHCLNDGLVVPSSDR
jgi:hypothetical protein